MVIYPILCKYQYLSKWKYYLLLQNRNGEMLTLWESINKLWTIRIWQIWQQDFTGFKAFPSHLAALSDKSTIYKEKKLDFKYYFINNSFLNWFPEYSCGTMYCVEIHLAKVLQTRMFDEMKLGVLQNLKLIKSCVDDVPTGPIEIAIFTHCGFGRNMFKSKVSFI